ncbi:MAG: hypothetical protein ACI9SJ_000729 [Flavobacteriaceae bacterium]|jgi:hypothetical protein|uniref:hypothetical protein n=1 Tax=Candidatus Marifrigoribacter sp. Uisw_064 TaxID=3230970 RepID=UPI003AE49D75
MKLVIQIVLWLVIVALGYMLYSSINAPVKFNEVKIARYKKVIKNLKDIKAAEQAHQEITGGFTGSFDSLVRFIDTAQFAIVERRDTSYTDVEKNKAFGLTEGYYIEDVILDTLNYVPVRDSLFGETDRYKTMMKVPVEGVEANFELKSGMIEKTGTMYSVFEAKVDKRVILADQDKDLVNQERQTVSVDGVNGPSIKVGALNDVDTSGNWPKLYDTQEDQ